MRRLLALFLLLLPALLYGQPRSGDWVQYPNEGRCIGGDRCPDKRIRIRLEDRPVVAVRFQAKDDIGETAGGKLRISIDRTTVRSGIDVPRRGELFTIDVDELRGSYLNIEPDANDEVQVSDIAVLYSRGDSRPSRGPDHIGPSRGGWRYYPNAGGCIGGEECRKNGNRITIALEDAPVICVRFFARDDIGTRADGKLNVRIDDTSIASYVDIQRNGKRHEFDVSSVRGSKLVISTATDDEVDVSDIQVMYGRRDRADYGGYGGYVPETRHEGGCIGGKECGGRFSSIRVPLRDRPVASIRFHARDDVGTRAGGELRVKVGDKVLRDFMDIPRDGQTFTINGEHASGEYLIIEPATNDEVVVKDIRVTYEP